MSAHRPNRPRQNRNILTRILTGCSDSEAQVSPSIKTKQPHEARRNIPTMPALSLVKASNDAWCPPYVPVVVVYGGTSGIAKAMTKRLAEQLQGRIHIIVVGRRKAIADALFASLPRPRPEYAEGCAYEFVFCDLRIMNSVHQATEEISNRCGKINYLILASGEAFFGRRRETEDGIESQLVLRYYYKFAVINDLLPKLRAAKDLKEAAGVFTILGHGLGPKIDFTNLNSTEGHLLGVGPMIYGLTYGDLMLSVRISTLPLTTSTLTPDVYGDHIRCTQNESQKSPLPTCTQAWLQRKRSHRPCLTITSSNFSWS